MQAKLEVTESKLKADLLYDRVKLIISENIFKNISKICL